MSSKTPAMEVEGLLQEQDMTEEAASLLDSRHRRRRTFAGLGSVALLAVVAVAGKSAVAPAQRGMNQPQQMQDVVELAAAAAPPQAAASPAAGEAAAKKKAEEAQEEASLKSAGEMEEQAKGFKEKADKLKGDAAALDKKETGLEKDLSTEQDDAVQKRLDAEKARKHAEELKKQAEALAKQAQEEVANAVQLDASAVKSDGAAKQTQAQADLVQKNSETLKSSADEALSQAEDAESKALDTTANARMCIDLPGVKLRGEGPTDFGRLVGDQKITDEVQCKDWCWRHAECKEAVWSWDTKACELFTTAIAEPIMFRERWPWYNSSFCGLATEKDDMLGMLHQVYDQKPWVAPPHNCSWGGDNCIDTKCCADSCRANWDWTKCEYFTCWKKDEYFGSCNVGPEPNGATWDGTRLGGHPNGEIAPAPEGKLIQGTRLYCFTVVMWSLAPKEGWMNSEAELANNWKDKGLGIMQCDDYSLFDGLDGGSEHNIQSFIRAWKMVKDDGRWKRNDWVIKVDADAVFFPDHLRKKIQWVYKTPQGATVYMRNTAYKFQFLGALEVLTREATEILFDRMWECEAKLGQQGGEDYWLLQCLEGIGIDYQTDVALLHDKYAVDENCADPNGVAHHFFKKVGAWDFCWNMCNEAWNNAHPE